MLDMLNIVAFRFHLKMNFLLNRNEKNKLQNFEEEINDANHVIQKHVIY